MSKSLGQTAILIFSRSASQEARAKTFDQHISPKGNRAIAQQLIQHTLATARQTRLPVFLFGSNMQTAYAFGENLANALESVFAKGYTKVIAIGNDCPSLTSRVLLEVSQTLTEHNLVLGPATDGGIYLLGITRSAYQRQAFLGLPWETPQLQESFNQYLLEEPIGRYWLALLSDIDYPIDFKAFMSGLPAWSLLRRQLLAILDSLGALIDGLPKIASIAPGGGALLRGPPIG